MVRPRRVSIRWVPTTSVSETVPGVRWASAGSSGRIGSQCCWWARTDASSRSGQRSAVSEPPKTQPVSMQIVPFNQSASGTGVCP